MLNNCQNILSFLLYRFCLIFLISSLFWPMTCTLLMIVINKGNGFVVRYLLKTTNPHEPWMTQSHMNITTFNNNKNTSKFFCLSFPFLFLFFPYFFIFSSFLPLSLHVLICIYSITLSSILLHSELPSLHEIEGLIWKKNQTLGFSSPKS